MCHFHSFADKCLVLNEVSFDMEVVISFEVFRFQVFWNHLERCSHVVCECSFGIGPGHEDHGSARRVLAFQEQCLYAVLLFVAFEQVSEFVFADFADECGCHAEDGCAGDGVGRRASCYIVKSVWFKAFEDFVSGFHIHELHAAFREVVHFQECVVRKDGQYVCEGISYA